MAKVIQLFPKRELPPKASAWLVLHREWKGGGVRTSWAFVFNERFGLTAFEAWQLSALHGNPPFYEVVCEQLTPFPNPNRRAVSASTKPNQGR